MNLLPTVAATALLAVVPFGVASNGAASAGAGVRDDHGHRHSEPGDDHGRDAARHTEPGDDHGRHGARHTASHMERGDDHGHRSSDD